jgi:hypothetical protein
VDPVGLHPPLFETKHLKEHAHHSFIPEIVVCFITSEIFTTLKRDGIVPFSYSATYISAVKSSGAHFLN